MAKHTVTMQIHQEKYSDRFTLMCANMTEYGYVYVGEAEVSFEVPDDFDPRAQKIALLKAQQRQAAAGFSKLCTEIQRHISELEAIEFSA